MSTTDFSSDPGAPGVGHDDASGSSSGAKEQAQQAASTAQDEGKRVAGVAKDEAQRVADEAKTQVRGLVDNAVSQVDDQARTQQGRLAETVRTFGDDLASMTSGPDSSSGVASELVQQASDHAKALASRLEDREPRELLDDVRSFARRRPGTFLIGALAAGVVVGRLTRGAKAAQDQSPKIGQSEPTRPAPVAGTSAGSERPADAGFAHDLSSPTDLGAKGVEMSETGMPRPGSGRA